MSVPAYKPNLLHGFGDTNSTATDFAQFTEELNAIQNSSFPSSSPSSLQSLFTSPDISSAAFISSLPKNPTASGSSSHNRNSAGRKNRMVEVKTINDRSVIVVSDPQAASATSRSHVVPLRCQVMGLPKKLEESKKKPVSPEPLYSRKVFIGGLPIDVTEGKNWISWIYLTPPVSRRSLDNVRLIRQSARRLAPPPWTRSPCWPLRFGCGTSQLWVTSFQILLNRCYSARSVSGYVFLVFQDESSVQELVNACELYDGKYYLQLSSPTMSDKAVQVRAWRLADIDYFADENALVDHRRTVFIGGVPRPTRASDLAKSLQEHYGKVSYVGIDIDPELKYPKGAARVTFASSQSFVRAISGRFVQVTHADTNKRVSFEENSQEPFKFATKSGCRSRSSRTWWRISAATSASANCANTTTHRTSVATPRAYSTTAKHAGIGCTTRWARRVRSTVRWSVLAIRPEFSTVHRIIRPVIGSICSIRVNSLRISARTCSISATTRISRLRRLHLSSRESWIGTIRSPRQLPPLLLKLSSPSRPSLPLSDSENLIHHVIISFRFYQPSSLSSKFFNFSSFL